MVFFHKKQTWDNKSNFSLRFQINVLNSSWLCFTSYFKDNQTIQVGYSKAYFILNAFKPLKFHKSSIYHLSLSIYIHTLQKSTNTCFAFNINSGFVHAFKPLKFHKLRIYSKAYFTLNINVCFIHSFYSREFHSDVCLLKWASLANNCSINSFVFNSKANK